jgi:hypothetical protein
MSTLEDIKTGDYVTVMGRYGPDYFREVIRTTKTQVITTGWNKHAPEVRWRKQDGKKVGHSGIWNHNHIEPITDEHRKIIYRKRILYKVMSLCKDDELKKLSTEKLKKVLEILQDE